MHWLEAFRKGFAPQLSTAGLEALLKALQTDDRALIQGSTTSPPSLFCAQDWPIEGACAVTYGLWKGNDDIATVGDAAEAFARACYDADVALDDPAACRYFLNAFDELPRAQMRQELSACIEDILKDRGAPTP